MDFMWNVLLNVIVLLGSAMVLGAVAERLKQSAIVGFMLAGVLLGPGGFGVLSDPDAVQGIATLGVVLLMFTIGLEFNFSRLRSMGLGVFLAGVIQIALTGALAAGVAMAFGVQWKAAVALGAALALSSTGVVVPVLQKLGQMDSVHGRFCLGILLVQDAAVVPLVLLVAALTGGGGVGAVVVGTLQSFGVVAAFIVVCWLFSRYVMPQIVKFAPPSRNREMPILFAFVAAMASAWAANWFGLSAALGAFIAAVFLGESVLASQLRSDLAGFKSVFVTLFFASIGMLAQPAWALENLGLVLMATGLVVLGKPVAVAVTGLIMRQSARHAVSAGVCMCQIGVFSFVLAAAAFAPTGEGSVPIFSRDLFNLVVAVTILALFATPYAVAYAVPAGVWVELKLRGLGLVKHSTGDREAAEPITPGHVIVAGFGPAGQAVAAAVRSGGKGGGKGGGKSGGKGGATDVVIADLNPRSVMDARAQGMKAFVGDASSPEILKLLGIETASAVVLTLPDHRVTLATIIEAKAMNPAATIVARARYHRYAELLRQAGAHAVIDEEQQVGLKLGEQVTAVSLPELVERSDVTKVNWLAEARQ
ncbi:MAG: cation:proton antiporter [Planctomycetota bacterium]